MSVNKVFLIGNVGKDPEVRYFDNGGAVANFSLATTERGYMAANGTQVPDRTEWHNVVLWRGLAEIAEKYVRKGSKIFIEGRIRTRTYDDAAGNKRYITEIWGDNMELLDRKPEGQSAPSPASSAQTGGAPENQSKLAPQENPPLAGDNSSDNLPF
ncbi:MAG: single-stranded DNA-binding protein [Dysgonamonadaceae bacterium]|nr:single-stranded DNA-binding protein [Dysgonamonadaceae bacterium]